MLPEDCSDVRAPGVEHALGVVTGERWKFAIEERCARIGRDEAAPAEHDWIHAEDDRPNGYNEDRPARMDAKKRGKPPVQSWRHGCTAKSTLKHIAAEHLEQTTVQR